MALKIKKQIKNSDGTITELEGTEAEVEAFLKKQSKKDESLVQKKKNLILGKEMRAAIQEMIDAAFANESANTYKRAPQIIEHHWHHYNGWWWKPQWYNGNYTFVATQRDPNLYSTTGAMSGYITCNTVNDLSSKIGMSANDISSNIGAPVGQTITTTDASSAWYGVKTNGIVGTTGGVVSTHAATGAGSTVPGNISSGIINLNLKS